MMELLSPAGDREALRAAVQNGADAVYLGAKALNARMGAGNFGPDELIWAADYLHERGLMLYVTVNVMVKQAELSELETLAGLLARAGADAAIVSDLGAAAALKKMLPSLALHASTQMAIHNPQGMDSASRLGISRVVLARELTYAQIEACASRGVEVEAFAHGALCSACSGQCLFSSLVGGRSGNRGVCAQPCRLPYRLQGAVRAEGHLLSTRDLMALNDLRALRDAGVRAIKIEGRLRRPEYVAVATAAYRAALTALEADGPVERSNEAALAQMFNRGGFARGYGSGLIDADLIEPRKPNHQGVAVGEVISAGRVRLLNDVEAGDALALRAGTASGDAEADRPVDALSGRAGDVMTARGARKGDMLIRLVSERQMREARASYMEERVFVRLSGRLHARPGAPAEFEVSDGVRSVAVRSKSVERATGAPVDRDRVTAQLRKTGGTPYAFGAIDLDVDERAYLPAALLNELRRNALDELGATRRRDARGCADSTFALPDEPVPFAVPPLQGQFDDRGEVTSLEVRGCSALLSGDGAVSEPRLRAQSSDPEALRLAIKAGCDGAVFVPDDLTDEGLTRAAERLGEMRFSLALPAVATGDTITALHRWAWHRAGQIQSTLATNVGHFALGWPGFLEADFGLNISNRPSLTWLWSIGVKRYTPSVELTAAEICAIEPAGIGRELIAYGRLPMMYLRHCPIRAQLGGAHAECRYCDGARPGTGLETHELVDRMGVHFPLRRLAAPGGCVVRVLNSVPLMVLAQRAKLPSADGWRLIFEGECEREIEEIVRAYRVAIDGRNVALLPEWEAVVSARHTTGHYFRGVS